MFYKPWMVISLMMISCTFIGGDTFSRFFHQIDKCSTILPIIQVKEEQQCINEKADRIYQGDLPEVVPCSTGNRDCTFQSYPPILLFLDRVAGYNAISTTIPSIPPMFSDMSGTAVMMAQNPGVLSSPLAKPQTLNVAEYGAVGDDVSDDSPAFINILAKAGASTDTHTLIVVPLPRLRYKITQPLALPSNTTVMGLGGRPTIHQTKAGTDIFTGSSISNVSIRNLKLVGPSDRTAHAGITITGSKSDIVIQDNEFRSFTTAIRMLDDAVNIRIENNYFSDPIPNGIEDLPNRIRDAYVTIEGPMHPTIPDHVRNIHIINNVWISSGRPTMTSRALIGLNSFSHNIIEGNMFDGWEHNGVVIGGAVGDHYSVANWNIIRGNTFRNLRTGTSRAIWLFHEWNYNIIEGNTIYNIVGDSIHLDEGSDYNLIAHNVITQGGDGNHGALGGIRIDGSRAQNAFNRINSNVISNMQGYGIVADNAPFTEITNNTIDLVGLTDNAQQARGIWVPWGTHTMANEALKILGNTISRVGREGIYIEGLARNAIIENKRIQNVSQRLPNAYDAIVLAEKAIGAATAAPDHVLIRNNTISDDPALGARTTRNGIRTSGTITSIDITSNDLRSLNSSAMGPFNLSDKTTAFVEGNRFTSGARAGIATLKDGTATVHTTEAVAIGKNLQVRLTAIGSGKQQGEISVVSFENGRSFTISSSSKADDRIILWEIVH